VVRGDLKLFGVSSKYVGIEEARGILGDLVTAAQQGTDIIITRNRRPAARLAAYQEETVTNRYYLYGLLHREDDWRATAAYEPVDTTDDQLLKIARDFADRHLASNLARAPWRVDIFADPNESMPMMSVYGAWREPVEPVEAE
jgi:prevent-host-death family protein